MAERYGGTQGLDPEGPCSTLTRLHCGLRAQEATEGSEQGNNMTAYEKKSQWQLQGEERIIEEFTLRVGDWSGAAAIWAGLAGPLMKVETGGTEKRPDACS